MSEESAQAVYLFCFARAGLLSTLDGTAIEGWNTLLLQPLDDIVAVLSTISTTDFSGPAAEARMQDPAWVVQSALRHDAVIEKAMRCSPVLPVRFGTIFSTTASLADCLARNYAVISMALDVLADREEWAVKGFLDKARLRGTLSAQALAAQEEKLRSLTPGFRYLQEQRIRADVETALGRQMRDVCRETAQDLIAHAVEFRQRQVLAPEGAGEGREMLLNWAFLLPRDRVADFRAELDRLGAGYADLGVTLECTGPWAPYSFCPSLGQEAET